MPLKLTCPECEAKLSIPEASAGKRVKCPKCQTVVEVPEDERDVEVVEDEEEEVTPKKTKAKKRPADEEDEADEAEEQPRKNKLKKKKGKAKKQSPSPVKLIATAIALLLALGAVAFAVIRHTSRNNDTVAKPSQNNDPAPVPTPTPTPNPNPPKTGQPTLPKTQPPTPKPEPTPVWDAWSPPKSGFTMRLPPAYKIEMEDGDFAVNATILGAGRVTSHRINQFRVPARGFQAEIHVLFLKPGLSEREREEVMLAQAKWIRNLRSLYKVRDESEVTWAGQKARSETIEGQDEAGFRRFFHTERAVYYLEAHGFADLAKHWMKDLTTSVDSFQVAPTAPTVSPADKPIEMTAKQWAEEAMKDENAFEDKYRGKKLRFTGKVSMTLGENIYLETGVKSVKTNSGDVVLCLVFADAKQAAGLKTGDTIVAEGEYFNVAFGGSGSCKKCRLVEKK
jgi:predicted Zn finger-like uncharacterized protein